MSKKSESPDRLTQIIVAVIGALGLIGAAIAGAYATGIFDDSDTTPVPIDGTLSPSLTPTPALPGSTDLWTTFHTANSTIDLEPLPPNGIKLTFNVEQDGWVGMYHIVEPGSLAGTTGLRLRYRGSGSPNTLEIKFLYPMDDQGDSLIFGTTWRNGSVTADWHEFEVPYTAFECWTLEVCDGMTVDPNEAWKLELAISNKLGDTAGPGEVIIDTIAGVYGGD